MFDTLYAKLIAGLLAVLIVGGIGFSLGYSRLTAYKLAQAQETAKIEAQYQTQAAQIEKEKNDKIASINAQLADALVQLHNRPSRPPKADTTACGTGSALYADDAEFLIREAARADQIRAGLDACYKQYDALK
jgi:Tfp pilus assembly protein PilO